MKNNKVAGRRIAFFMRWFRARRRMSAAEAKEAQDVAGKKSVEVDLTRNLRVGPRRLPVSITFDRA